MLHIAHQFWRTLIDHLIADSLCQSPLSIENMFNFFFFFASFCKDLSNVYILIKNTIYNR